MLRWHLCGKRGNGPPSCRSRPRADSRCMHFLEAMLVNRPGAFLDHVLVSRSCCRSGTGFCILRGSMFLVTCLLTVSQTVFIAGVPTLSPSRCRKPACSRRGSAAGTRNNSTGRHSSSGCSQRTSWRRSASRSRLVRLRTAPPQRDQQRATLRINMFVASSSARRGGHRVGPSHSVVFGRPASLTPGAEYPQPSKAVYRLPFRPQSDPAGFLAYLGEHRRLWRDRQGALAREGEKPGGV